MKKPHFFCENCGTEVPRKAAKCPGCGRFFSSVRCPKCGFVGAEQLFEQGCPVCGYSSLRPPSDPRSGTGSLDRQRGRGRGDQESSGNLPAWVYVLTVLAVVGVTIAAFLVLR
jgi:hypothetical protein